MWPYKLEANLTIVLCLNFQFNYSSGQPAPESITDKIYGNTLSVRVQFIYFMQSLFLTIFIISMLIYFEAFKHIMSKQLRITVEFIESSFPDHRTCLVSALKTPDIRRLLINLLIDVLFYC